MAESPPSVARAQAVRTFGRFELRELLGRSAATMAWLAFDTAQQRLVMLTLPRRQPGDAAACERWLAEARRAGRLEHPHLARPFEIGIHDHWPFIAVERGAGQTLAERLAASSHCSAAEAAHWMAQALEALAFAHDARLAHLDLQLHSLLIDEHETVRVMALGAAGGEDVAVPLAHNGRAMPMDTAELYRHRQAAARDVMAAGLLLHRLLAGQPPLDEPDTGRAMDRLPPAGRETLRLPWSTPHPIPEALRAIANRATDRQPRQRYHSARTLLRALTGWLEAEAAGGAGLLGLLLDRLSAAGPLPALPDVQRLSGRLLAGDDRHTGEMAREILPDIALSLELLRAANAPQHQDAQLGGSAPVLTVRRSLALVGLNGLRQAVAALRSWPGPLSDRDAGQLRQVMQRTRLAAHLARLLRPAGYDGEVVHLLAVLQNLGRLLVQYHFPDDAAQIRQLMEPVPVAPEAPARPGMTESAASYAVLGVELEALGLAVAGHWGLGHEALHMMRRLPPDRPVRAPDSSADLLRMAASAANEAVDALDGPAAAQALATVAQRYARALSITARDLGEAVQAARTALGQERTGEREERADRQPPLSGEEEAEVTSLTPALVTTVGAASFPT